MHTSKYGRSALTKSPMMMSSFRCSGLPMSHLSANNFKAGRDGGRTFPELALSIQLPCVGPSQQRSRF